MKTTKMKLYRLSLTAAALGSLLAFGNVSQAQDTNITARAGRRGPTVQQRVERMTTELKLNDDQKTKVTALLADQGKQRRELASVPREERREKMRALAENENTQLKMILTPEQFEKWQKLREQMRARRPGGPGQPGSPAPAPAPAPNSPDTKAP